MPLLVYWAVSLAVFFSWLLVRWVGQTGIDFSSFTADIEEAGEIYALMGTHLYPAISVTTIAAYGLAAVVVAALASTDSSLASGPTRTSRIAALHLRGFYGNQQILFYLLPKLSIRNGRRTALTALAVALGLVVVMAMSSLIEGMVTTMLADNIRLSSGHLQIRNANYEVDKASLLAQELAAGWRRVGDTGRSTASGCFSDAGIMDRLSFEYPSRFSRYTNRRHRYKQCLSHTNPSGYRRW